MTCNRYNCCNRPSACYLPANGFLTGPTGPAGPSGPPGPTGPSGSTDLVNIPLPVMYDAAAWSFSPYFCSTVMSVGHATTLSTILLTQETAVQGIGLSCFVDVMAFDLQLGIYSSSGQLLANTAILNNISYPSGIVKIPLVTPITLPPGVYLVAFVNNNQTYLFGLGITNFGTNMMQYVRPSWYGNYLLSSNAPLPGQLDLSTDNVELSTIGLLWTLLY